MNAAEDTQRSRPKSSREIWIRTQRYFAECTVGTGKSKDSVEGKKPPTLSGLALALGFENREELRKAVRTGPFRRELSRAVARCEAYLEQKLLEKESYQAARFSLESQFDGWGEDRFGGEQEIRVELTDE